MVLIESVFTGRIRSSAQISKDIRAPKRIDRLLGIAHHKNWLFSTSIYRAEDVVLHGISVLEFVQQDSGIIAAQTFSKRLTARSRQGRLQVDE